MDISTSLLVPLPTLSPPLATSDRDLLEDEDENQEEEDDIGQYLRFCVSVFLCSFFFMLCFIRTLFFLRDR